MPHFLFEEPSKTLMPKPYLENGLGITVTVWIMRHSERKIVFIIVSNLDEMHAPQ